MDPDQRGRGRHDLGDAQSVLGGQATLTELAGTILASSAYTAAHGTPSNAAARLWALQSDNVVA